MSTEETHLIHIPTGLTESEFPEMISISIICRLCANQSEKLISIYSEDGVNNDLAGKMNLYLPIKVTETDNLPLQCCWQCASTVLAWHDLVVTSVEADRRLKSYQFVSEKQLEEITSSYGGTENILTANDDEALEPKETKGTITSPDDDSSNTNPVKHLQSFVAAEVKATREDTIDIDTSETEENTEHTIEKKPKRVDEKETTAYADLNSITCNLCKITFNSKILLKTHLKTIHSVKMLKIRRQRCDVPRNFKCSWCDKSYSKNHDLTRHLQAKHGQTNLTSSSRSKNEALLEACRITGEGDLYKCDICPKTFAKFSNLRRHRTIHTNLKAYCCSQCEKSFKLKTSLTKHISEVHDDTRRYQCEVCKKSFKNKWSHDEHLHIHTDFRPYVCDICGKSFRQKAALYNHKRYHSTERLYECNVCHKQFHRNQTLVIHYRIHTGHKPHCCGECGARFASKQAWNRHKKCHESVRCDKCGCKFEQIRYLKLHSKTCKPAPSGLSEDGKNDGVIMKNVGFCGEIF